MRRFDKKKNMARANQLAEQRYKESKGLINESFHDVDGKPIGVDHMHRPIKKENFDTEAWQWDNKLKDLRIKENFSKDDLKRILEAIYFDVYEADRSTLLSILRYFNLDDE